MTAPARVDLLAPLRALLSDETKWTKRAYARDSSGLHCEPRSSAAVCWCLNGALIKAGPRDNRVWPELRRRIYRPNEPLTPGAVDGETVAGWQDKPERTFADIQQLLKEPYFG